MLYEHNDKLYLEDTGLVCLNLKPRNTMAITYYGFI